ncbi:MAG: hypothetical protein N3D20_01290 [Candidatus Pacearchaeota archaeon]|nr:hypothetical protein [Candidatus Pacearchaeota archaeon]
MSDFLETDRGKRACYFVFPICNPSDSKLEKRIEMEQKFRGIYPFYAIRFYNGGDGKIVGIGDGARNNYFISAEKWNEFVRGIRGMDEQKLDKLVNLFSLIGGVIFEDGRFRRLIEGIRNGKIGEI